MRRPVYARDPGELRDQGAVDIVEVKGKPGVWVGYIIETPRVRRKRLKVEAAPAVVEPAPIEAPPVAPKRVEPTPEPQPYEPPLPRGRLDLPWVRRAEAQPPAVVLPPLTEWQMIAATRQLFTDRAQAEMHNLRRGRPEAAIVTVRLRSDLTLELDASGIPLAPSPVPKKPKTYGRPGRPRRPVEEEPEDA